MMLFRFLLGTSSILLTQLVVACAMVGIGVSLRRRFGLRALRLDDCLLAFWVGLAVVTLFLIGWNFFFPVNGAALGIVLVSGVLGLVAARRELARVFQEDSWAPSPVVILLMVVAGLWLANLSLGPLDNYDSALYHLQAVRWAEDFPAVPGIGNLDGPLAFNNSYLLIGALLSSGVRGLPSLLNRDMRCPTSGCSCHSAGLRHCARGWPRRRSRR